MKVDQPPRTLSITSPSPKDGKTFNAVSLAVVMAQSGKRVLIVDTDPRRGRLHRVFDRENEVGVVDLLMKQVTVQEACQETEIENLQSLAVDGCTPAESSRTASLGSVSCDARSPPRILRPLGLRYTPSEPRHRFGDLGELYGWSDPRGSGGTDLQT